MKKRRTSAAIELTPLLDVIMIMLFIILTQSTISAKETLTQANEKTDEALKEVEELSQENLILLSENEKLSTDNLILEGKLLSEEGYIKYVTVIAINFQYKNNQSIINVTNGTDTEIVTYKTTTQDEQRYGGNKLEMAIRNMIVPDEPTVIIFHYDNHNIFLDDYNVISTALNKFDDTEDVYIKYEKE